MHKHNLLIITNSHALGCARNTIDLFTKLIDRKLFTVRLVVLSETDFTTIYQIIKKEKIDTVLTNSIYFGEGKKYTDALTLLAYCRSQHIRTIDIAHFAKLDAAVDALLDNRLFVSKILLLKYVLMAQKRGLPIGKYDYIYNPIKVNRQSRSAGLRSTVNKSDFFTIGRVGRADINKWDNTIIDVLPYLVNRIPNLKVLIRSMPKEYEKKISQKLRKIITVWPETESRKEILDTIGQCDVLIQTSKIGESFGCAIAEGMAMGKPIITNSTDFLAPIPFDRDNAQVELVEDGKNGFVENDLHKMADRIVELYSNKKLYRQISERNQQKVQRLYDPHLLTKRLESFLLNKAQKTQELPITFREYKKRVKPEQLTKLMTLNIDYLLRRAQRKARSWGLLSCC